MILSVSRRTDIPAFYSKWFMNRLRDGFVYVRNPFNSKQISRVNIKPEVVDCIVFWTKNAKPLTPHLREIDLRGYKYYFHFTITPYGQDLEQRIVNKTKIIDTFKRLSSRIGPQKVILRYDPIILTDKYSKEYHIKAFTKICNLIKGYTDRIVSSFLDNYRKVSRNMKGIDVKELSRSDIAEQFSIIATTHGLSLETCAEAVVPFSSGIKRGKCIDGDLIEKIIGNPIKYKDSLDGNRQDCGCMKCIDIGQYDSCIHNCLYCYANVNKKRTLQNYKSHDPKSPILFGEYDESNVKERKDVKSYLIDRGLLG
ncbi:MAG: DUF1848 domain-containing protein [Desulfotomaculaceae bacterium]|nr:DUF1848 domain-containing protein [Desulfotomaculaceae bacterium]